MSKTNIFSRIFRGSKSSTKFRKYALPFSIGTLIILIPVIYFAVKSTENEVYADILEVANWHFDEGYGTTVGDASTFNNPLTLNSATWAVSEGPTRGGRSLQFNGINDYAYRTTDTDFNFGTNGFSISGMFRHPAAISSAETIVNRYSEAAGFSVYLNSSGNLCFSIDDDDTWDPDDTACSTATYVDGSWYNFEAVKNGTSSIKVYVNGEEVGSDTSLTATGSLSASVWLYVGVDWDGFGYFKGFLDEIVIYPYTRSVDQVKTDVIGPDLSAKFGEQSKDTLTDGLVGWWKMDESSGNVSDSSGAGFTLTNNNSTTSVNGRFGFGGDFNGTNQYFSGTVLGANPVTITNVGVSDSTKSGHQRKTWHDGTRYWMMLYSQTNNRTEFWYSTDGSSWTENTGARLSISSDTSIVSNSAEGYLGIAYRANYSIMTRDALNYPGTSFTWGTDTVACMGDDYYETYCSYPHLALDSYGFIWIAYQQDTSSENSIIVKASMSENYSGSWDGEWELDGGNNNSRIGVVLPLSGTNIYAIWSDNGSIEGAIYNGSTWTGASIDTGIDNMTRFFSATVDSSYNVHLAYIASGGETKYKVRSSGTWQSAVTLDADTTNYYPSIQWNGTENKVYAFWIRANTIYAKTGTTPFASGNWDTSATALVSTGTNTYLTSGLNDYGNETSFIGWMDSTNVKWSTVSGIANSNVKTISFWAKPDSTSEEFIDISSTAQITSSSGQLSATGLTNPRFYVNGVETTTIAASAWQHVTVTSDTGVGLDSLSIGKVGSSYYDGKIDEVRLYSRGLNSDEIRQSYVWVPGPIGHWKFDEGSGSNAYDSSGNGFTGTIYNSPSWIDGKFGKALDLTPASLQYVSVAHNALLNPYTHSFTYEGWVKFDTWMSGYGDDRSFISKLAGGTINGYHITAGYTPRVYTQYSNTAGTDYTINNYTTTSTDWMHVAVTANRETEELLMYVNGQEIGSTDLTGFGTADTTAALQFGRSLTSSYLDGAIDEIKIYNYARSPEEIVSDMNGGHPVPGSPIGSPSLYYKFDTGYGSTAYNSGTRGSGANGTLTNAIWSKAGKYDKAVSFDGSGDYVSISNGWTGTFDEVTVSMWMKGGGGTDMMTMDFGQDYTSRRLTVLTPGTGGVDLKAGIQGNCMPTVTNAWTDQSDWHHVAYTFKKSGSCYIYKDGELIASDVATSSALDMSSPTGQMFGARFSAATYYWNGLIDEVKIYESQLSADQIKVEYARGKSSYLGSLSTDSSGNPDNSASREYCVPGDTSTCNTPVAEWKFEEASGATVYDSSGNGLNGTISGTVERTDGKYGKGIHFIGTGFVQVNHNTLLNPGSGSYTWETWVKQDKWPPEWLIYYTLWQKSSADMVNGYKLSTYPTKEIFNIISNTGGSDNVVSTNTDKLITTWYHLVSVLDSSNDTLKMYVNGVLEDEVSTATMNEMNTASNLYIGARWSDQYYLGYLDEIRFYNYARTPAQAAWSYNKGEPMAHWRMDDCTGNYLRDAGVTGEARMDMTLVIGDQGNNESSGSCSSGTGTEAWNNGTSGRFNSSISLDGEDDYAWTADNAFMSFTYGTSDRPFTIAAWLYIDSDATGNRSILTKYASEFPYREWVVRVGNQPTQSDNRIDVHLWDNTTGGYITVYNDTDLPREQWVHATITYDGSASQNGLKIFLNGIEQTLVRSTTGTYSYMRNTDAYVKIGAVQDTSTQFYKGKIDDLRVYRYALTQQQVNTVLSQGAAVRFSGN